MMERLTFKNGDGVACVMDDQCYEEQSGHYCGPAIDRLADYEDLGMLAEEIVDAVQDDGMFDTMQMVQISAALDELISYRELGPLEHLRELAEAEKDGRLVVLPVKPVLTPAISRTLYIIEDGEIYEDSLYEGIVGMSERGETNVIYGTIDALSFEQNDIGKTVFLTREEAEKALEAMQDGNQ